MMRPIQSYNFKNRKTLIRVDFNVPLDAHNHIIDSTRIDRTLPTIRKVLYDGGSTILISHLGRPQGGYEPGLSMQHLVSHLSDRLSIPITFVRDCIGPEVQEKAQKLQAGEVLLLENLRFHPAEIVGDLAFSEALASLGEVYVQDAFATVHRPHASTTVVAQYFSDKLAGFLLQEELNNADKILSSSHKPFTAILGGAKVSDKIQVIEWLLNKVDYLLIGGLLANVFQQALYSRSSSALIDSKEAVLALEMYRQAQQSNVNLLLPTDVVIGLQKGDQSYKSIVDSHTIPAGWVALDIGPVTCEVFNKAIQSSNTILWSGPLGFFENINFSQGTQAIATAVVKATKQGTFSFICGGDSASAIKKLGYSDQVSYISTGGGALLAYLVNPDLPGIKVLC